MSTPTHLVLSSNRSSLPVTKPQLLPFHTPYSGPAPVSTFFLPRSMPDSREDAPSGSTLLLGAFRGRQLVGQKLNLPTGYEGIVLSVPEKKQPVKQEQREGTDEVNMDKEQDEQDLARAEEDGRRISPRKRKVVERFKGPPIKKVAEGKVTKKFRIDSDSDEDSSSDNLPPPVASFSAAPTTAVPTSLGALLTPTETTISSSTSTPLPTALSPPPADVELVNDRPSRSPSPIPLSHSEANAEQAEKEEDPSMFHPPPAARELKIVSTFGQEGIVLWSPDDPVDKGRDEYFRCLGKGGWMELAEALHQEEEEGGEE